jgi:glutamate racemase
MPNADLPKLRDAPIGIFDSGLGGLTVARAIHELLPKEDLVYLGDTARVPYGTKSPATVTRFAREDAQFLVHQTVKAIVVACNSASAWGLEVIQRQFEIPIFGVILPGAKAALEASANRRIGVIGTNATINSEAYQKTIRAIDDSAFVFARACPLLVPLVEEGWIDHPVTMRVWKEYLQPLRKQRIDTLVLGCTHYPLLKRAIQEVVGDHVSLVDSAESCARFVEGQMKPLGLLLRNRRRKGRIQPFVTDAPDKFGVFAERFLGCKTESPQFVELKECGPLV